MKNLAAIDNNLDITTKEYVDNAVPTKTSELTNDSGFITSETDPTVPSWAKASSKPKYTASEITNAIYKDGAYVSGGVTYAYSVYRLDESNTVKIPVWNSTITNNNQVTTKKYVDDAIGAITIPTITLNGSATTSPSFYAPTSAGTSGYYLKSNGSGAPSWSSISDSDENVKSTLVTTGGTYYIVGSSSSSTNTSTLNKHDSVSFFVTTNTSVGDARLILGNSTTSGTNSKKGLVRLYGSTAYYTDIISGTPSENRTITLPNATGTVALTSDIPTIPTNISAFTNDAGYVTTDTKNTAGSTDSSSKIYLIGATTQAANPQTYSNDDLYFDGGLYSKSTGGTNNTYTEINQNYYGLEIYGYNSNDIAQSAVSISSSQVLLANRSSTANYNSQIRINDGNIDIFTQEEGKYVTINDLIEPTNDNDAATKKYVDDSVGAITVPTKTSELTNDSGFVTTDTKNTAGSTNTNSKIYLIGATEQSANPQTYSNSSLYFNHGLYSFVQNGNTGAQSQIKQDYGTVEIYGNDATFNRKTVINVKTNKISISGKDGSNDAVEYISVGYNGNVVVTGLVTPTNDTDAANKKYVDDSIGAIPASTDEKVKQTVITNDGTLYRVLLGSNSDNYTGEAKNSYTLTYSENGGLSVGDRSSVNANYAKNQIVFTRSTAGYYKIAIPSSNGTNKVATFPEKTGTIAFTDDIPTIPTNVSAFTNDAGYITGYTETDPVFSASAASGITSSDITNWNNKAANSDFTAPTSSAAGTHGLVPAPPASGVGYKVLNNSGDWRLLGFSAENGGDILSSVSTTATKVTYFLREATTTQGGLMSSTDKSKLDNLSDTTLPITTTSFDFSGTTGNTYTQSTLDDSINNLVTEIKETYNSLDTLIPTVPTNVSAFTNDAGYLTSAPVSDITLNGSSIVSGGIADITNSTGDLTLNGSLTTGSYINLPNNISLRGYTTTGGTLNIGNVSDSNNIVLGHYASYSTSGVNNNTNIYGNNINLSARTNITLNLSTSEALYTAINTAGWTSAVIV